jgi:hypothetical protein
MGLLVLALSREGGGSDSERRGWRVTDKSVWTGRDKGRSSKQWQEVIPFRCRAEHDHSKLGERDNCSGDQNYDHRAVFKIIAGLKCVVPVIKDL